MYVTVNAFISQQFPPLVYKITYKKSAPSALLFLQYLRHTRYFSNELPILSDMVGVRLDIPFFNEQQLKQDAITTKLELLQKNPSHRDLLLKLTSLYLLIEDTKNARTYLQKAKAIDPFLSIPFYEKRLYY
jgi:hypothetical protein